MVADQPFGMAADEGVLHATVTVAVEFEVALIRLLSEHPATPAALHMDATDMIEAIVRMMREREVGHLMNRAA